MSQNGYGDIYGWHLTYRGKSEKQEKAIDQRKSTREGRFLTAEDI